MLIPIIIGIILLVLIGGVVIEWANPYLEYKKLGSYAEYQPRSKSLNNKQHEYEWYQVNGFKNIKQDAIEYLYDVSRCHTKNDLEWLNECRVFLERALIDAGETDASKFSFSTSAENASFFEILKVIKRSRKPLSEEYQKFGCSTCGEAVVMHLWIMVRIERIENGADNEPGDMNFLIDAIKEINKYEDEAKTNSDKQKTLPIQEKKYVISDMEKQRLLSSCDEKTYEAMIIALPQISEGNTDAMLLIALQYKIALHDDKKAVYWLTEASNAGNAEAMFWLGGCYIDGTGVPQDKTKGMGKVIYAATLGSVSAIEKLKELGMSEKEMRELKIPI